MPQETLRKLTTEIKNEILNKISTKEVVELIAKTKAAGDSGTFEVVISTEDLDRQGEIVKQEGIDFGNYMQNPVVLWGHDYYSLPIGVTESIEKRDGKTIAKGRFAPEEANPFAQQVRRMYEAGMVRTTSVGIIPQESAEGVITRCELLEYSFVPVPANPYALSLRQVKELGLDLNMLALKSIAFSIKENDDDPAHGEDADNAGDDQNDDDHQDNPNNAEALEHLRETLKSEHAAHVKNIDEFTTKMHKAIIGDDESSKSVEEFTTKCNKAVEEFRKSMESEHARHDGEMMKAIEEFKKEYPGDEEQNADDPKSAKLTTESLDEIVKVLKAAIDAIEKRKLDGDEGRNDDAQNKGRKSAGFESFDEFLKGRQAVRDVATMMSKSLERMNKFAKEMRSK